MAFTGVIGTLQPCVAVSCIFDLFESAPVDWMRMCIGQNTKHFLVTDDWRGYALRHSGPPIQMVG